MPPVSSGGCYHTQSVAALILCLKGQREGKAGKRTEVKGGARVAHCSPPLPAQGEKALLKWHREEGGLRTDWTPHSRDRHFEGIKQGDKIFSFHSSGTGLDWKWI